MKNKSIIARLATSALIAAMTIGTVSSADSGNTNTSSVINVTTESTGIIKYDRNKNGAIDSDDVYFTAEDINSLAQSINALSQNYETLNQKRLDIINAMNATVTKKFYSDSSKTRYDDYSGGADMATTGNLWDSTSDDGALPTTASFDSIVQTLSTLTTPSTATATRYTATANGWLSGTSSDTTGATYTGTSSQATTLAEGVTSYVGLNASGESTLTLGVNESLTLESGYYSDPVTINNGVVNRGSLNSVLLTSNSRSQTFAAGYYDEFTVYTDITSIPGTIVYTHHQDSTSSTTQTYQDNTIKTTGAASVGTLRTFGSYTASTVKGGCYTTPLYYYSYTYSYNVSVPYQSTCSETYNCHEEKHGSMYENNGQGGYTTETVCDTRSYSCTQYRTETKTGTNSGYTTNPSQQGVNGNPVGYLKSCGYENGETLSATISYNKGDTLGR